MAHGPMYRPLGANARPSQGPFSKAHGRPTRAGYAPLARALALAFRPAGAAGTCAATGAAHWPMGK